MNNSILTEIKKLLGVNDDYKQFDVDIIIHINAAFSVLNQLGVGPETPFHITDKSSTWSDFIADANNYNLIQQTVYLYVKLNWDPQTNSFLVDNMKKQLEENEWRLNVMADKNQI